MSVATTAKALGTGWELVNQVAVTAGRNLVYTDPIHLAGVRGLCFDSGVLMNTCGNTPTDPGSRLRWSPYWWT
jgi:hypothetical protein